MKIPKITTAIMVITAGVAGLKWSLMAESTQSPAQVSSIAQAQNKSAPAGPSVIADAVSFAPHRVSAPSSQAVGSEDSAGMAASSAPSKGSSSRAADEPADESLEASIEQAAQLAATQQQLRLERLDAMLSSDGPPSSWAQEELNKLDSMMESQPDSMGVELVSADCGESLCRLEMLVADSSNGAEVLSELVDSAQWTGQLYATIDAAGQAQIYFARPGTSIH